MSPREVKAGIPGNRAEQQPRIIRTLAAALSRTGTVCELEVPLGVGNTLVLEVTAGLSSHPDPTAQQGGEELPT